MFSAYRQKNAHNSVPSDSPDLQLAAQNTPAMPRVSNLRALNSIPAESGAIIRRACSACDDDARVSVSPQLEIGASNDPAEREADIVADRVMGMSVPKPAANITPGDTARPAPVRMKQGGRSSGGSFMASGAAAQAINNLSGGAPLPSSERQFFEPRFGRDLSHVRLHTGATADRAAKGINARAFTRGNEISFASGQYRPGTSEGRHLMAHELAHTLQSGSSIRRYRDPKNSRSFNYGYYDTSSLIEQKFVSTKTQPWIESVSIVFDHTVEDTTSVSGKKIATDKGTAAVKYKANGVQWPDFSITISGGSKGMKTDRVTNKLVHRIEGWGYNSGSYSGTVDPNDRMAKKGWGYRYSKNVDSKTKAKNLDPKVPNTDKDFSDVGNMGYAVFYNGGEALHFGNVGQTSHGCVHVSDWKMRQLNYHSVAGRTKVSVKYV